MAANYTSTPTAVQAPSAAPAPGVLPIFSLPQSADGLDPTTLYQALKATADALGWGMLREFFFEQLFGSGADGNQASGFGTLNMTRDMEWNNLTMLATDRINTNGFFIKVRGTFTAAAGAILDCSASGTTPGGNNGTIGCGGLGGAANGGSAPALVGIGAGGGNAGAGGTGATPSSPTFSYKSIPNCLTGAGTVYSSGVPATTFVRGGGGGGGGNAGGGTGGAGGAGAGVVWMAAKIIAASSGWTVQAIGGNGAAGVGGNANGGGGGGGGAGVLIYNQQLSAPTITLSQGGGSGGAGVGTGAAGINGSSNATLVQIQF